MYRILSKVNQVSYTLDTICEPNIMILAQGVLEIFCWQGSIGLQCVSRKREIIKPNIDRILPKVNQVIYTLDSICEPNIMILAQAVLQIFCWQGSIGLQYISRKRGIITEFYEKLIRSSVPSTQTICLISWSYLKRFSRYLLAKLLYCIECQSWKREIIQPNIDRVLPKVNQVIYTLVTICWLVVLRLNVPVNNFSVMSGRKSQSVSQNHDPSPSGSPDMLLTRFHRLIMAK